MSRYDTLKMHAGGSCSWTGRMWLSGVSWHGLCFLGVESVGGLCSLSCSLVCGGCNAGCRPGGSWHTSQMLPLAAHSSLEAVMESHGPMQGSGPNNESKKKNNKWKVVWNAHTLRRPQPNSPSILNESFSLPYYHFVLSAAMRLIWLMYTLCGLSGKMDCRRWQSEFERQTHGPCAKTPLPTYLKILYHNGLVFAQRRAALIIRVKQDTGSSEKLLAIMPLIVTPVSGKCRIATLTRRKRAVRLP